LRVGGGSGVGSMDRVVKRGKWSDGDSMFDETDGLRQESDEVMTRSRV
jgi:hypothetical protein